MNYAWVEAVLGCFMEHDREVKEDVTQSKKNIRRHVLAMRDTISADDKAQYDMKIREIVTGMKEYREADVILAYVSYKSEVDTTMLIQQALADGKYVFAPKVSGKEMEFWRITAMENLREGYRGISEPVQSISFPDWIRERRSIASIDTVIDKAENCVQEVCKVMMWMPGSAFDTERHRIGYGGGFYDRYLNRLSCVSKQIVSSEQQRLFIGHFTLTTAALAYHCQVLGRIPYEEHDRKPDLLVTEQEIYR